MKKLSADLKRMLSALAFADAGELLSTQAKRDILQPTSVNTTHTPVYTVLKAQQNTKPKAQVAILFDGHASEAVLDYLQSLPYIFNAETNILAHGKDTDLAIKTEQLSQRLLKAGRKNTISYLNNEASDVFRDYCNRNPELRYMIAPKDDRLAREIIDNPEFHRHSQSVPLILIQDNNRTSASMISAA